MLTKSDVINFGEKIVASSTSFDNAVEAVSDYLEYLEKFFTVTDDIITGLNILLLKKYPNGLFRNGGVKTPRTASSYYSESSCGPKSNSCGSTSFNSGCGSSYSNSCGSSYRSHC